MMKSKWTFCDKGSINLVVVQEKDILILFLSVFNNTIGKS